MLTILFLILGTAFSHRGGRADSRRCRTEIVDHATQDTDLTNLLIPFSGAASDGEEETDDDVAEDGTDESTSCVMRGLSRSWPHEDAEPEVLNRRLLRRGRKNKVKFDVDSQVFGALSRKNRDGYLCYEDASVSFAFKSAELSLSTGTTEADDPRRELQRDERGERGDRGERSERGEDNERGERDERAERSERLERAQRAERGERGERGETGERSERGEVNERGERDERAERSERLERAQRAERGIRGENIETNDRLRGDRELKADEEYSAQRNKVLDEADAAPETGAAPETAEADDPRRGLQRGGGNHGGNNDSEEEAEPTPYAVLTLTQTNALPDEDDNVVAASFDMAMVCRPWYRLDDVVEGETETCSLRGLICYEGQYSFFSTDEGEDQEENELWFQGMKCSSEEDFHDEWEECNLAATLSD